MVTTEKTWAGGWYTVTASGACRVTCTIKGDESELVNLPEGGQDTFQAPGAAVDVETDGGYTVLPSKAPCAGGVGGRGDGSIGGDLVVGHGAADAVAAVCTLALGDLSQGGTLTDGTTTLTLDDPHTKATGRVGIADAAAAGTIKFGEHGAIEFEAKATVNANLAFTPLETYGGTETPYKFSTTDEYKTCEFEWDAPAGSTVQDLKDAINDADGTPHWHNGPPLVDAGIDDEGKLVLTAKVSGAYGNGTKVTPSDNTPFVLSEEAEFTNGQDARTARDLVDALNASADCPAVATLDADELGISFTAKEHGVNDEIAVTGGMFGNAEGMEGGHGDFSVQEIVSAINAETDFAVTAAAAETEGAITLTANTAGAAANAVTYTATGCFGGGRVRQGSTVRGRNAVAQTAFKIYLNGEELDVEPAPLPTALTPTTAMRNGGVYTITAAFAATALSLPANATAEIWVRIGATAFNVDLPASWVWVNGEAGDMTGKTYTTFCIAVRNDGARVLASMAYSYETTPAQP